MSQIIDVTSKEVWQIPEEGEKGDDKSNGPPAPSTLDDHRPWEERPIPKQIVREVTSQAVREAYREAKERGIGTDAGNLIRMIEEFLKPRINWRRVLRKWAGDKIFIEYESTRKRPSRRHGWNFPGERARLGGRLWVAVDNSGSVSPDETAQFLGEIGKMLDMVEVVLVIWDTAIRDVHLVRSKRHLHEIAKKIGGGGGTRVEVIFHALSRDFRQQLRSQIRSGGLAKRFRHLSQRPDGIAVLTDGDVNWPPVGANQGIPTLWGVTRERNVGEHNFGQGLYIEVDSVKGIG